MSNTEHCISFRPRSKKIVLREDFLDICLDDKGSPDFCAAMVLSQHMHWYETKLDHRPQAAADNAAMKRAGKEPTQRTEYWVYKSQAEMREELMERFGEKAVAAAYNLLVSKGYLGTRDNPHDRRDRTKQFLFNVGAVQDAIDALPSSREIEKAFRKSAECNAADLRNAEPQKCGMQGVQSAECKVSEVRSLAGASTRARSETTSQTTAEREDSPLSSKKNSAPQGAERPGEDGPVRTSRPRFVPPTLDEVTAECESRGYRSQAEPFWAYYDARGWCMGKAKMQKWRSALAYWLSDKPLDSARSMGTIGGRGGPGRRVERPLSEIAADVMAGITSEGWDEDPPGYGALHA